ncbi:hypothetical protein ACFPOE_04920 [Caenimonas terrae]|uniref:Uncharacterized protein n=1 Tax=Caenimonas terrae TaxID=696074 RepID=A0ABW0ND72_9BURK
MDQKDIFRDTFIRWRRSYLRLRMLERNFVSESRSGRDPARIAAMYEKVEAVRAATTALFHSAQTASMAHQIPPARAGETTLS